MGPFVSPPGAVSFLYKRDRQVDAPSRARAVCGCLDLYDVWAELALLRFVWMAGVHLLEVDRATLDEEPDAGGALQRRLVLPALVGFASAGDGANFASQRVVGRGLGQRASREKVPGFSEGISDRCGEVLPTLGRVGSGIANLVLDFLRRPRDKLAALGGHHCLWPLYNGIVVQPLRLAPAQAGGDGSRGLFPRRQLGKYQMRLVGGERCSRRVNEVLGADRSVLG